MTGTPPPLRRLITIDVLDGSGKLLPGFNLQWWEDNKPRGTLTSSTGQARLEPVKGNSIVEIEVEYQGQPQRQKLAVTQQNWTFTYNSVNQPPAQAPQPPPGNSGLASWTPIIVALIGLVGVLAVGYWQFGPKPEPTPTPREVTLTIYVKNRSGGAIPGAQVRLERSAGPETRGADGNGAARFTVAIGPRDVSRAVVTATGFRENTQSVPAIERDTSLDVFLEPLPERSPPPSRPLANGVSVPSGTWQVQMSGNLALRRITAGSMLFSPQPDGGILFEGSITLDGAVARLRGKAGRQNTQLFLEFDAESGDRRWHGTGNLEGRQGKQMAGHVVDAAGREVPLELKQP